VKATPESKQPIISNLICSRRYNIATVRLTLLVILVCLKTTIDQPPFNGNWLIGPSAS